MSVAVYTTVIGIDILCSADVQYHKLNQMWLVVGLVPGLLVKVLPARGLALAETPLGS